MSTNFVIVMGLILIELTLVIASVLVYTLFRIAMRELKNTRCDYNFRMAKLQELCETKSGVQQLITEQYKTLIEQYHDFHEVWKQTAEYYKELSEHYSVLEDRYSDIYEQYEQLNKRIEDLANAMPEPKLFNMQKQQNEIEFASDFFNDVIAELSKEEKSE